ncbi:hypothetical protein HDV05_006121, partial [Chytridiales sp. JEL 0842]
MPSVIQPRRRSSSSTRRQPQPREAPVHLSSAPLSLPPILNRKANASHQHALLSRTSAAKNDELAYNTPRSSLDIGSPRLSFAVDRWNHPTPPQTTGANTPISAERSPNRVNLALSRQMSTSSSFLPRGREMSRQASGRTLKDQTIMTSIAAVRTTSPTTTQTTTTDVQTLPTSLTPSTTTTTTVATATPTAPPNDTSTTPITSNQASIHATSPLQILKQGRLRLQPSFTALRWSRVTLALLSNSTIEVYGPEKVLKKLMDSEEVARRKQQQDTNADTVERSGRFSFSFNGERSRRSSLSLPRKSQDPSSTSRHRRSLSLLSTRTSSSSPKLRKLSFTPTVIHRSTSYNSLLVPVECLEIYCDGKVFPLRIRHRLKTKVDAWERMLRSALSGEEIVGHWDGGDEHEEEEEEEDGEELEVKRQVGTVSSKGSWVVVDTAEGVEMVVLDEGEKLGNDKEEDEDGWILVPSSLLSSELDPLCNPPQPSSQTLEPTTPP